MNVIIENIRCFQGLHDIPITPLTLLVGENSAGKSTFLAVLSAIANSKEFPFSLNFNTPPYDLGNYENIASKKSNRSKPAPSFSLGFATKKNERGGARLAVATCKEHLGRAVLSSFSVVSRKGEIKVKALQKEADVSIVFRDAEDPESPSEEHHITTKLPDRHTSDGQSFMTSIIVDILTTQRGQKQILKNNVHELFGLVQGGAFPYSNTMSMAPVRSKPRRHYDQFNIGFNPDGDHIPLRLAELLESTELEEMALRDTVRVALSRFGTESSLFENVEIKRFGKGNGSPFAVSVETGGLTQNLIDVGYGVSQCLPIVVESLMQKTNTLLLMQQPEVHLHPKAQAALGSFFCNVMKSNKVSFAIETHSDYLVDRIRQEIANKRIQATDVSILFFERGQAGAVVHPIALDALGNIVNRPKGYRQFFLEEEMKLLRRGHS